jgi:DNA-binding transcriptional ArsR family regulator
MSPNPPMDRIATLCSALSHPQRVMIVLTLGSGERDVSALCDALGCSQSRTSQQLAILRNEGVVVARREGRRVFYSLVDAGVAAWARQGAELRRG